jgi:hypothetical protein
MTATGGAGRRTALVLAVGLLALAWCYGPTVIAHMRRAVVERYVTDDTRVWVTPFLRQRDAALFPHDLLQDYALACVAIGYRALLSVAMRLGDPIVVVAAISYALYACFLLAIGCAAARFGGVLAALAAVALCLSGSIFIERIAGATPRAFAFPLLAAGAAALAHGRLRALAVLVVVAAAFYGPAALPLGVALAVVAVGFGARWRGDLGDTSLPRRLVLVALTGFAALALLLPTSFAMRPYGRYITPADIDRYPEAGHGGRFLDEDSPPYPPLPAALSGELHRALSDPTLKIPASPAHIAWLRAALIAALVVLAVVGWRDAAVVRVAALGAIVLVGYEVAAQLAPWLYLPERYARYPVPMLAVLALVAAPSLLARRLHAGRWGAWLGGAALGVWMLFGPHGSAVAGLNTPTTPSAAERYLMTLPAEVLIAGWPNGVDSIPLRTGRSVLLSREHHMPFQTDYADEMRRRFAAVQAAYLATDPAPLRALRDQFGVTHLVVNLDHFGRKPLRYFKPFDAEIAARLRGTPRDAFLLPHLRDRAAFASGPYMVLDLRTLE